MGIDGDVCVGLWESPGDGILCLSGGLSCRSISPSVMKQIKHLVHHQNWLINHWTLIVQYYIPRWRALSPVFSPDNKPGNLNKPERHLEGCFWSFQAMAKKSFADQQWRTVKVVGTGCEWADCVSCLPQFVSQCFWLITLPSFPLSSCQTISFFSKGEVVEHPPHHPHSLPLPAHSAFSRWHLLPTHLHCVPIMHTDSKAFACACKHTHKLTRINSQNLLL